MEQYKNIPDTELIYGNDCPYITIQWKKGWIYVSNAVFRLIGKPARISLKWNIAKRTLIIEPTNNDDLNGLPVINHTQTQRNSLFICSATLIHEIWSVLDWDKRLCFKVVAKYNESSNVAIFEMKDAIASEIQRKSKAKLRSILII